MLVALLLLLAFTLWTTVVSIFSSISWPLVVTIMTIGISMVFINTPGVMSNNTRMVITRLLFFMFLFFWYLMTLLVLLVMTMRSIMLLVLNMSM